jgi:hypothetical protein
MFYLISAIWHFMGLDFPGSHTGLDALTEVACGSTAVWGVASVGRCLISPFSPIRTFLERLLAFCGDVKTH